MWVHTQAAASSLGGIFHQGRSVVPLLPVLILIIWYCTKYCKLKTRTGSDEALLKSRVQSNHIQATMSLLIKLMKCFTYFFLWKDLGSLIDMKTFLTQPKCWKTKWTSSKSSVSSSGINASKLSHVLHNQSRSCLRRACLFSRKIWRQRITLISCNWSVTKAVTLGSMFMFVCLWLIVIVESLRMELRNGEALSNIGSFAKQYQPIKTRWDGSEVTSEMLQLQVSCSPGCLNFNHD